MQYDCKGSKCIALVWLVLIIVFYQVKWLNFAFAAPTFSRDLAVTPHLIIIITVCKEYVY